MYDLQDFEQDVIIQSQTMPVLVDFWAPWCGPCKALGPVLEKVAGEQKGRFRLVKINSDEHQEIAQQFGVRGIPSVKLIYQAQLLGEFTGAQPESAVKAFLDQYLPPLGQEANGKESEGSDASEAQASAGAGDIKSAQKLFDEGNPQGAWTIVQNLLTANENDVSAKFLASRILAVPKPEEALKLTDDLAESNDVDKFTLEQVRYLAYLLSDPEEKKYTDSEVRDTYLGAIQNLKAGDLDQAIQQFIDVVVKDRYYDEDGSRKILISIFTTLGPEHPATVKYRREFDRSLY